jgi:ketosteroid isomerase-like protein
VPLTTADIVEIYQLYARYSHAIDSGDGIAYAACFTPDGIMDTTVRGVFTGPSELATVVSAPERVMRHVPLNIVLTEEAGQADAASGRAYLVVYSGRDGKPEVVSTGRYVDRLAKQDGAWRFTFRQFIPD